MNVFDAINRTENFRIKSESFENSEMIHESLMVSSYPWVCLNPGYLQPHAKYITVDSAGVAYSKKAFDRSLLPEAFLPEEEVETKATTEILKTYGLTSRKKVDEPNKVKLRNIGNMMKEKEKRKEPSGISNCVLCKHALDNGCVTRCHHPKNFEPFVVLGVTTPDMCKMLEAIEDEDRLASKQKDDEDTIRKQRQNIESLEEKIKTLKDENIIGLTIELEEKNEQLEALKKVIRLFV